MSLSKGRERSLYTGMCFWLAEGYTCARVPLRQQNTMLCAIYIEQNPPETI